MILQDLIEDVILTCNFKNAEQIEQEWKSKIQKELAELFAEKYKL